MLNLTLSKFWKTLLIVLSGNVLILGKNFFINLILFADFILLIFIIKSSKIFLFMEIREIFVLAIKLYLYFSLTKWP